MCKETFGQDAGGAHQPPAWPHESLSTHDSLTNREDRWTDKQRLDTVSGLRSALLGLFQETHSFVLLTAKQDTKPLYDSNSWED